MAHSVAVWRHVPSVVELFKGYMPPGRENFHYKLIGATQLVNDSSNPDIESRVVGGTIVNITQYAFAAQFYNMGAICGGVILNSFSILTAAHCFDANKDIEHMRVQVGSKYIYDFNAQKHKLKVYVVHENYNKRLPFEADLAIIFLEKNIHLTDTAYRCILVDHKRWMTTGYKDFEVIGWGWTKYGGAISEMDLMMARLKFVPLDICSRLHNISLSEDMFCLYGDGERDACKGDSGGAVIWQGKLVGLTSHGDGCAKKDKPSVYMNIFYFREWIKKQVYAFVDSYCSRQINNNLG